MFFNFKYKMRTACKKKVFYLCSLLLTIGLLYVLYSSSKPYLERSRLSLMATDWNGFGPEKGLYNFTVVTALIDIGRGQWGKQAVSYNTYLLYMQHLLKLDVNMIIFIEDKGKPFVDWMRRGRQHRTKVIPISLKELPYYRHRERMQEIMDSVEYRTDNELLTQGDHCEAKIPDYDIVQLSKCYFVHRAIELNFFGNTYYFWIDGGYGHGDESIYPPDGVWFPTSLLAHQRDKLTFLQLKQVEKWSSLANLHKRNINIIAGGVFGGGVEILKLFYFKQQQLIENWMEKSIVDDDQTAVLMLYFQNRNMFNLVQNVDWWDLFKKFNDRLSSR